MGGLRPVRDCRGDGPGDLGGPNWGVLAREGRGGPAVVSPGALNWGAGGARPWSPGAPSRRGPQSGPVPGERGGAGPRCWSLQAMAASEPPNFSWVAEGRLAGLAMPREPGHYRFLQGQGVRHLVSLSERAPPHHGCCPAVRLHRLRVPDFSPPTPAQIQSFLRLVEEANARGEARKMNGGDAIREIRRLRPGSIETREQEQAVIQFCQSAGAGADSEEA
ncbi:dual specificity protein phosphatase 23 isoform X2 [Strix uralensis]|uniref:dual specificity protein phosphatase 23 isoform X2 n=1 Tax=Strix uralensis TaxID=36305 RepID=UPI003DA724C4